MNIRKVFSRRVRHSQKGLNVAGDMNAVLSANVNEPGSRSTTSSVRSRQRIVQRSGQKPGQKQGGGEGDG
jgi:hypothetical protein